MQSWIAVHLPIPPFAANRVQRARSTASIVGVGGRKKEGKGKKRESELCSRVLVCDDDEGDDGKLFVENRRGTLWVRLSDGEEEDGEKKKKEGGKERL